MISVTSQHCAACFSPNLDNWGEQSEETAECEERVVVRLWKC